MLAGAGALGGAGVPGMAAPAFSAGGGGSAAPEEEEASVDISRITGRVKSSTYNRLNELVEKNPDEALNVIRQWVSRRT
jgi:flagellar M-ring protein FliF